MRTEIDQIFEHVHEHTSETPQTTSKSWTNRRSSKYPQSIHETKRKQNISPGHTNIADDTFDFFLNVTLKRKRYHNTDSIFERKQFIKECNRGWDIKIQCDYVENSIQYITGTNSNAIGSLISTEKVKP